jgi:tRNA(fMet)-specific endonuclease VapC
MALKKRFEREDPENLALSSIVYAEISYGLKKRGGDNIVSRVHAFMDNLRIVDFDRAAADMYAKIRVELERSGDPLENMDMLIAASAMSAEAVLVSHNTKHFSKIKGLKVEDWC